MSSESGFELGGPAPEATSAPGRAVAHVPSARVERTDGGAPSAAAAAVPAEAAARILANPLLLRARLALLRPRPVPLVKKPDPWR